MGRILVMGKLGSKAGWVTGAWLMATLLAACASPVSEQQHRDRTHSYDAPRLKKTRLQETRPLEIGTRPSAKLHSQDLEPISIHGRLVSRKTGNPISSELPRFVVVVSEPTDSPGRSKPPSLIRDSKGFSPSLSVVPLGERVRFDNRDKIFHNFFSTSIGNEFDLSPLDPGNSAFIRFQRTGLVHVYCSLHSGHRASVLVLPSATFARVNSEGEFDIQGLAAGRHLLELWSPGMTHQDLEVFVTGNETQPLDFPLDPIPAKAGR